MRRSLLAPLTLLATPAAVGGIGTAGAASDPSGTLVVNGHKVFPIVLAKGPDATSTTPSGTSAFAEVAAAGVTFLKIGPPTAPWTQGDIDDAKLQDRAAAANGLFTWVNLSTV